MKKLGKKVENKQDIVSNELNSVRLEIDRIDKAIVDLLAKRRSEVDRVTELKKRYQLPVYHPAREEDVIYRRREQGKNAGLDPDFIEELFRLIIRSSRVVQTDRLSSRNVKPGANVLIVGGTGSMGKYFHGWFNRSGYTVRILGRKDWPRVEALCKDIDLAVMSVPIDVTSEMIEKLSGSLPEHAVLTDITSIKEKPLTTMLKAHPGPVIGLHPLFGPSTTTMDKQIVVWTPGRNQDACNWVLEQLAAWGAILVKASAEEHDEIMGFVQALRHYSTFAFGRFLAEKRTPISRTLEFSSPIYRLELGMVGRLFAQDPSLYSEIIFASEKRKELLREYIESFQQNMSMIEEGDKKRFAEEFRKIAEWFGPFSEQAMRESSFLIDKLIERF